jgi:thiamine kinase-like enzyme
MIKSIGSDLELKQSFVHGDLAANIRASGEELYIIDWELGRAGAKEIELLYLFEHSEMPEEKREKVIEHYHRKTGLSDGFEEAREIYPRSLAFNDLMWAAKRKEKARKQEDGDVERYEEMFRRRLNRVQEF